MRFGANAFSALQPQPDITTESVRSGRRWYMCCTTAPPTEHPTSTAASSFACASTASQHASARSTIVSPSLALGERPYPGRSTATQRNHVEKCAVWYSQLEPSIGLGCTKTIGGVLGRPNASAFSGPSICVTTNPPSACGAGSPELASSPEAGRAQGIVLGAAPS